jgi:hypothetical protein
VAIQSRDDLCWRMASDLINIENICRSRSAAALRLKNVRRILKQLEADLPGTEVFWEQPKGKRMAGRDPSHRRKVRRVKA